MAKLQNAINRLLYRLGYIRSSKVMPVTIEPWERSQGVSLPEDYGAYSQTYRDIVWVYACAYRIANSAAMVPYRMYKEVEADGELQREEQPNHPAKRVLDLVNPYMTAYDLIEGIFTYLELQGTAYIEVVENVGGQPSELYLLRPERIKPVPDPKNYIAGWIYEYNGRKIALKPEQVIQLKYFNPNSEYFGQGAISAARNAVIIDRLGTKWNRRLIENNSVPGGLLYTEEPVEITPEERQTIRLEWERLQKGPDNAGRIAVASGFKFQDVQVKPRDMEWLQQKRLSREETCAAFGVPPILVGILDRSTYNNYESAMQDFWQNTMIPKLEKVGQAMNEQFVSRFDDDVVGDFDTSGVAALQEDEAERTKIDVDLVESGIETINERRALRGKPPVAWGDVWWAPMNKVPAGQTGEPESDGGTEPQKAIRPTERARLWTPTSESGAASVDVLSLPPITWDENDPRVVQTRGLEEDWTRSLKRFWQEEQNVLLRAMRSWGEKALSSEDEIRIQALVDLILARVEPFAALVEPYLYQGILRGGAKGFEELGIEEEFDLIDRKTVDFLHTYDHFLATERYNNTRETLRKTLIEGMEAGESVTLLQDRVNTVYTQMKDYDAERLARTEMIRAANAGKVAGYRQSGVVSAKQWVTVGDDRMCTFCESMAGTIVPLDDNYWEKGDVLEIDGKTLKIDYGSVTYPPLHPMCRCTLIAVL